MITLGVLMLLCLGSVVLFYPSFGWHVPIVGWFYRMDLKGLILRSLGTTLQLGRPIPDAISLLIDVADFPAPANTAGTVSKGPEANQCTLDLTGVPNQQYTTAEITGATDNNLHTIDAAGTMGVLIGDTNADKAVNSADISQTKSQSGQSVGSSNFREDLNVDNSINSADISLVKSKSGTGLP